MKHIFFWVFICSAHLSVFAQRNNDDFNIWTGVSVEKKIVKKIKGEVELQNRLNENATEVASNFLQLGVSYNLKKGFGIATDYRFTHRVNRITNRFDIKLDWKEKIVKRTWFKAAVKWQTDKDSDAAFWDNLLRFRWQLEHKIKKEKLFPYISNEWFFDLSDAGHQFNGYRISVGLEIEPKKDHAFTVGYVVDREINTSNPDTRYILALSYKLDL